MEGLCQHHDRVNDSKNTTATLKAIVEDDVDESMHASPVVVWPDI